MVSIATFPVPMLKIMFWLPAKDTVPRFAFPEPVNVTVNAPTVACARLSRAKLELFKKFKADTPATLTPPAKIPAILFASVASTAVVPS